MLNGYSRLDSLSANYLHVAVTDVSNISIGCYNGKGKPGNVVALSYTITPSDAASDSQIMFFTPDMKPIAIRKLLKVPGSEDFLLVPKGSAMTLKEAAAAIIFPTVVYTLQPDKGLLTATLTVDKAMTIENFESLKTYLHPVITYRWTGKRFEKSTAEFPPYTPLSHHNNQEPTSTPCLIKFGCVLRPHPPVRFILAEYAQPSTTIFCPSSRRRNDFAHRRHRQPPLCAGS